MAHPAIKRANAFSFANPQGPPYLQEVRKPGIAEWHMGGWLALLLLDGCEYVAQDQEPVVDALHSQEKQVILGWKGARNSLSHVAPSAPSQSPRW